MKIKIDAEGHVVLTDGKPVYVADDGKEFALDGGHLYTRVTELTREAASHRQAKEAAETRLRAFEGIEDPSAALKALQTVASLDQKSLVDAGKLEEVKIEAIKAAEARFEPVVAELEKARNELHREKIGGFFARSKVIADRFAIPADLVEAKFGHAFKLEEGRVVAYDQHGAKLYSRVRPGELADPEEAIEMLVAQYPHRDAILKGNVGSGGGAQQGAGAPTGRTMTQAAFSALSPKAKAEAAAQPGFALTD